MEKMEEIIMPLIVESGEAKSAAFEAIRKAKEEDMDGAAAQLNEAKEHLLQAHHRQTSLLQQEAAGQSVAVSLLMVHAQDHLMTAMTVKDLAEILIDLYQQNHELRKVAADA